MQTISLEASVRYKRQSGNNIDWLESFCTHAGYRYLPRSDVQLVLSNGPFLLYKVCGSLTPLAYPLQPWATANYHRCRSRHKAQQRCCNLILSFAVSQFLGDEQNHVAACRAERHGSCLLPRSERWSSILCNWVLSWDLCLFDKVDAVSKSEDLTRAHFISLSDIFAQYLNSRNLTFYLELLL